MTILRGLEMCNLSPWLKSNETFLLLKNLGVAVNVKSEYSKYQYMWTFITEFCFQNLVYTTKVVVGMDQKRVDSVRVTVLESTKKRTQYQR